MRLDELNATVGEFHLEGAELSNLGGTALDAFDDAPDAWLVGFRPADATYEARTALPARHRAVARLPPVVAENGANGSGGVSYTDDMSRRRH
ncbi:hypothetical protein ACQEVG_16265 [Streptomyces sp. CA-135486]|uniref:hypothetical protein n=1 Tax=Streptomyces sp. CA-135486 TaxID=3240049 RepID=UPI003D8E5181